MILGVSAAMAAGNCATSAEKRHTSQGRTSAMSVPKRNHSNITLIDVADGEFMLRKLEGRPATVRQIEKEFRLPKMALAVYRANNYSRQNRSVTKKG